jgi:hypothetical protein
MISFTGIRSRNPFSRIAAPLTSEPQITFDIPAAAPKRRVFGLLGT